MVGVEGEDDFREADPLALQQSRGPKLRIYFSNPFLLSAVASDAGISENQVLGDLIRLFRGEDPLNTYQSDPSYGNDLAVLAQFVLNREQIGLALEL